MPRAWRAIDRVLPALLMAASVSLLAFGLLSYAAPMTSGDGIAAGGTTPPSLEIPSSPEPAARLTPVATAEASAAPTGAPSATPGPSGSSPGATPSSPVPSAAASPSVRPAPAAVATRLVVPSEGIDLPVISGEASAPGQGPDGYPLCDVAQYLRYYGQPGEPGTTYLYAHARAGMFLPLLEASMIRDGASLIGAVVQVYTDDDRLHVYEIERVKRHATDFALADNVPEGEHRLVLQTSEGPRGTVPKLQIRARPITVLPADHRDAHPRPRPRGCYDG